MPGMIGTGNLPAGWHLPGGGVESRETAVDAIVREAAEEGGVEATATPTLIGFYANHANFPNDHEMLKHGIVMYDALYTWCRSLQAETHNWPARARA